MATAVRPAVRAAAAGRRRPEPGRLVLHGFLIVVCVVWLVPLLWALYEALRPITDTTRNGYFSLASTLDLSNFTTVWTAAQMPQYYWNTLVIVVPGVTLTLLVSSMLAFALTQFSWRFNLLVLMLLFVISVDSSSRPFLPRLMMYAMSNARSDSMIVTTTMITLIGPMTGNTTRKNVCRWLAPSIAAASRSVGSTLFSPAR